MASRGRRRVTPNAGVDTPGTLHRWLVVVAVVLVIMVFAPAALLRGWKSSANRSADLVHQVTPAPGVTQRPNVSASFDSVGAPRTVTTTFGGRDPFAPLLAPSPSPVVPEGTVPEPEPVPASPTPTVPAPTTAPTPAATATAPTAPQPTSRPAHFTPDPTNAFWTVIVESLPDAHSPRRVAVHDADDAFARGVAEVDVLHSTRFPSLYPGYWVVYSERLTTRSDAIEHADELRSLGYGDAYERCVGPAEACASQGA